MQDNKNNQMRVVKNNQKCEVKNNNMHAIKNNNMHAIKKNDKEAKKIAHLETTIVDLLVNNQNSVLHEFAKIFKVTPRQILEPNKCDHMCDIRHLYCYLRCVLHKKSFSSVGREINRSHNAVSKGVKRIEFSIGKYTINEEMWERAKNISEISNYKASASAGL